MNKIVLMTLIYSSFCFSQKLSSTGDLPAELRMIIECPPQDFSDEEANRFSKDFNTSLSHISPRNLKIFTKTELYKFIVNFDVYTQSEISNSSIDERIKNLLLKKRRFCKFEQWILYSINTDRTKIKKSKSRGYKRKMNEYTQRWIQFFEKQIVDPKFPAKKYYYNFLKNLSKKANIFSFTQNEPNRTFVKLNKPQSLQPDVTKKEQLDKIFKENLKKDN